MPLSPQPHIARNCTGANHHGVTVSLRSLPESIATTSKGMGKLNEVSLRGNGAFHFSPLPDADSPGNFLFRAAAVIASALARLARFRWLEVDEREKERERSREGVREEGRAENRHEFRKISLKQKVRTETAGLRGWALGSQRLSREENRRRSAGWEIRSTLARFRKMLMRHPENSESARQCQPVMLSRAKHLRRAGRSAK